MLKCTITLESSLTVSHKSFTFILYSQGHSQDYILGEHPCILGDRHRNVHGSTVVVKTRNNKNVQHQEETRYIDW